MKWMVFWRHWQVSRYEPTLTKLLILFKLVTVNLHTRRISCVNAFYFKKGLELFRQRDATHLEGCLAVRLKSAPQGAWELSMDDMNKLVAKLKPYSV